MIRARSHHRSIRDEFGRGRVDRPRGGGGNERRPRNTVRRPALAPPLLHGGEGRSAARARLDPRYRPLHLRSRVGQANCRERRHRRRTHRLDLPQRPADRGLPRRPGRGQGDRRRHRISHPHTDSRTRRLHRAAAGALDPRAEPGRGQNLRHDRPLRRYPPTLEPLARPRRPVLYRRQPLLRLLRRHRNARRPGRATPTPHARTADRTGLAAVGGHRYPAPAGQRRIRTSSQ